MVHRNFEQTEEIVNNLTEMYSKLDIVEDMLAAEQNDITGPARNLLPMHYHLNQLEGFRNQTMHQAKKASADARNTLTRWFERLNKCVEAFDEHVATLAHNILPIVRAGHPEVVVKLIKIAEIEGKADEKVRFLIICFCILLIYAGKGYRHQAGQESREDGRCVQIQVYAG